MTDFLSDAIPPRDGAGPCWAIADVERETGIGKDTLRVWERRYGFPTPVRDAHGDRCYDAEQLGRLRLIRRLLDSGLRPGRVVGLPREALEALVAEHEGPPPDRAPVPATRSLQPWMDWLRQDQAQQLRQGLREAVRSRGLARVVDELVAPLAVAVGQAWVRGELSVYQEHLFTEAVQTVLREAIAQTDAAQIRGLQAPRVLLTTTPGEPHQLGLLMAECHLALEGCERLPLGPRTPVQEIVAATGRLRADVVALSYSLYTQRREVVDTLCALRERLPPAVELWVGGAGVRREQRRLPPDVSLLARASDVALQVRAWRQRHGVAHVGGDSGSSAP
jgi:DNA-binding transcriptional MerR regulator/methylmalonyl-CoA mutase cobalamin-binding subunit